MGDFFCFDRTTCRLEWPSVVLTLVLAALGSHPAWGQTETGLTRSPQILAQASSQQFHQMLFVNPITGNDQQGEGSLRSPFRSITHAIQFADPGTVIFLSTGTYDERSGERFPILLPPEVRLQEDPAAERGSVAIAGPVTQGRAATAQRPVTEVRGRSQPAVTNSRPSPTADPVPTVSVPMVSVPRNPVVESAPVARSSSVPPAASVPVAIVPPSPPVAAIPIPVPPPESDRPPAPAPAVRSEVTASSPRLPAPGIAIEIPVPPPDNPLPPAARRPRPQPAPVADQPNVNLAMRAPAATSSPYDLLPVPDGNVPLGYTGDLPRIPVPNGTRTASVSQRSGGSISRNTGNLRYRVLVRAHNERVRDWVRSVIPDAFETEAGGETMMQIGAFQSLENAEEAAEQLSRSGIRAIIEEWR